MNRARISFTLMLYMMRHLALRVTASVFAIVMIVAIIDTAELFRRVSNKEAISSLTVLMMEAVMASAVVRLMAPLAARRASVTARW